MPSGSSDTRSSYHPRPFSVRDLTRIELRRQLLYIRRSTLGDLISEQNKVAPASPHDAPISSSSSKPNARRRGESETTGSASAQTHGRRNSWKADHSSLVPAPLNPHPRRARSPSPIRIAPTPPPSQDLNPRPLPRRNTSHPFDACMRPSTTAPASASASPSAIPATIARARAMQQDAVLQLGIIELSLELEQFRFAILRSEG